VDDRIKYGIFFWALSILLVFSFCACTSETAENQNRDFSLWQMPCENGRQMMGYVLKTAQGRLVVIDGGLPENANHLVQFIKSQGSQVSAWFITHPHIDHGGAIAKIIGDKKPVRINAIYGSLPTEAWVKTHCKKWRVRDYQYISQQLMQNSREILPLKLGQRLQIDNLEILVLGIHNPEIARNPLNNSSVVLKVSDPFTSVLFLGDLGVEGGNKILHSRWKEFLKADYVQMAHHGQRGVSKAFYQRVRPAFCLWPTPMWLWENNRGKGYNTGPWKTVTTRKWMDEIGVKQHFLAARGLLKIR
jgi:beta-lactamase superfamily II metal-dependent hydrolase